MKTVSFECPVCRYTHREDISGDRTSCEGTMVLFDRSGKPFVPTGKIAGTIDNAEYAWALGFFGSLIVMAAIHAACWLFHHVRIVIE